MNITQIQKMKFDYWIRFGFLSN